MSKEKYVFVFTRVCVYVWSSTESAV